MKIIFEKNAVTNITARVPPSSQTRINIDEDVGSGCEGDEDPMVTPLAAKKKRACHLVPLQHQRLALAVPRGWTILWKITRMRGRGL